MQEPRLSFGFGPVPFGVFSFDFPFRDAAELAFGAGFARGPLDPAIFDASVVLFRSSLGKDENELEWFGSVRMRGDC